MLCALATTVMLRVEGKFPVCSSSKFHSNAAPLQQRSVCAFS